MNIVSKITNILIKSIELNKSASLIVSGGSSPIEIFKKLSICDLNWKKVFVTLVDDRMVAPTHADSNEALVQKYLLVNKASEATFIPLNTLSNYSHTINRPFDVTLLGMGEDGHFASLFPDMIKSKVKVETEALNTDSEPTILTTLPKGYPKHPRITMNLSMILDSKLIILIVNNKAKKSVLDDALKNKLLPVHYLLSQNKKDILIEASF